MTFSGASLALGRALKRLLSPNTKLIAAGCHIKPTFRPTSQSNQEMVHCCYVEYVKTTLQNDDFFFFGQLRRHLLIELFHLSGLPQIQMTVEWSMLSSWATSHVVVRESVSVIALNWSLSASNGHPLHSVSSRLSYPLQNFLNHYCTVCLIEVLGQIQLLMLQVVSTTL